MTATPNAAPTTAPRFALLEGGFRLFFPLTALQGIVMIGLWVAVFSGAVDLPLALDPIAWHVHEMLVGFIGAAIGGFLLTAIPNWTGRPALRGTPLVGLAGLWLLGRLAATLGGGLPPAVVLVADLSYPVALWLVAAREILLAGNRRNFVVLALLAVFVVAAGLLHAADPAVVETGELLGIYSVTVLVVLIGGRIVPTFTANWLRGRGREPAIPPFSAFDRISLAAVAAAIVADLGWRASPAASVLLIVAGVLLAIRLLRWRGWQTLSASIVWVLHVAYAWLPIGLVLLGIAGLGDVVTRSAGLHALTVGAMATMILAVMTRASLGHSGRRIEATSLVTLSYLLISLAAVLRVLAGHWPGLLHAAALAFIGAWLLFLVVYLPILMRPRAAP